MHNFSNILEACRSFLSIPQILSDRRKKLSHQELVCSGRIPNLQEFVLPFCLEDFGMVDEIILWIMLCVFCCFSIIEKSTAMHQSFKRQPRKMVKHTQTIFEFDHFVRLALKENLKWNLGGVLQSSLLLNVEQLIWYSFFFLSFSFWTKLKRSQHAETSNSLQTAHWESVNATYSSTSQTF